MGRGYTWGVDRYVLFYGSFSMPFSLNAHWRACTFLKNASPSLNVFIITSFPGVGIK